jgi:hypothetical protein
MKYIAICFLISITVAFGQSNPNFRAQNIKANSSFKYSEAQFLDYIRYTEDYTDSTLISIINTNSEEGLLSKKFENLFSENTDSVKNKLILISKLSLKYNLESYSGIKYKSVIDNDTSQTQLIILRKDGERYLETSGKSEIETVISNILRLQTGCFVQFDREEVSERYKELSDIISLVKDTDETLNLHKLSNIIILNPSRFQKYFEW